MVLGGGGGFLGYLEFIGLRVYLEFMSGLQFTVLNPKPYTLHPKPCMGCLGWPVNLMALKAQA